MLGPTKLPSEVPYHASQMFSNNVTKLLLNMITDGQLELDLEDQIIADTLVTRDGEVISDRLRQLLDLEPLTTPDDEVSAEDSPSEDSSSTEADGAPEAGQSEPRQESEGESP